jgi:hypothetical protein
MALLANVALTNTFDTWRLRTNALLTRVNQFAINESSLYANTLTANVAFTAKGTATVQGLATLQGRATVGTNLTVSGNTTLGGAGKTQTTTGAWSHTGTQSISSNLTVSGNTSTNKATVTNLLTVSGNTTIGGAGKVANATGWFGVNGRQSISTNLFVGGNTFVLGSVGIGTASPQKKFVISNAGAVGMEWSPTDYTGNMRQLAYNRNTSAYVALRTEASQHEFYIGGVEAARIESSGQFTACNSIVVNKNLTVSGNTTLNGTTTDKSNALSQTLTDGATITWDTSLGRVATVTLGGNRTIAKPTNLKVGTYILRVYQDGTGSRTLTWNAAFKWTAQTAPVLTTTANAMDVITFFSDGNLLYGSYLPDMR